MQERSQAAKISDLADCSFVVCGRCVDQPQPSLPTQYSFVCGWCSVFVLGFPSCVCLRVLKTFFGRLRSTYSICLFTRLSSAFPPFVFVLCSPSPRSPILGGLGSLSRIICVTWRILINWFYPFFHSLGFIIR